MSAAAKYAPPMRKPWRAEVSPVGTYLANTLGQTVAENISYPEAVFIARCVNSHSDLVSALQAMKRCPGVGTTDQESGEIFAALIDAALAKAEGRAA